MERPRPPVTIYPLWKLCLPPVLITAASAALIITTIDAKILALNDLCISDESPFPELAQVNGIGPLCCALSTFFAATVALPWGKLFMSTFLSFVASLMTISLVESQRSEARPNRIVRHPVAPWMALNVLSGAVVAPLVMAPASFHHSQVRLCGPNRTTAPAATTHAPVRSEAAFTVPIAVLIGFVAPSAWLVFSGSPAAVVAWQFFPVFVVASLALQHRVAHSERCLRPEGRFFTKLQSERSDDTAALWLFSIPIVTSVLSHVSLMIFACSRLWTTTSPQADGPIQNLMGSAILLLAINYGTIYLTVVYWLYIEGGAGGALEALKWTVLAGSGAGVCKGWTFREKAMRQCVECPPRGDSIDVSEHCTGSNASSNISSSNDVDGSGPHEAGPLTADETQPLLRR